MISDARFLPLRQSLPVFDQENKNLSSDDDPEAYDIADEYEGDSEDDNADDDDDDTDTFLTVYSDLDEDDYEEL